VLLLVFVGTAARDFLQRKSAIQRNFPLFGGGRTLIAAAGTLAWRNVS